MEKQQKKSKQAEYNRRYYLANRERIARQRLERAEKDPDEVREVAAKWRDANRDLLKKHYETNRSKRLEQMRKHYKANCERLKARRRHRYELNRQKELDSKKAYRIAHPEQARLHYEANRGARNKWHWQYQKTKMAATPSFAVYGKVMRAMHRAARRHKLGLPVLGTCAAVKLLGCCWDDFLAHIQPLFKDGMTWANHGQRGWHFDHIKPLSSFDLTDEKQLREACHFTNVQPLWAADNIRKGAKIA